MSRKARDPGITARAAAVAVVAALSAAVAALIAALVGGAAAAGPAPAAAAPTLQPSSSASPFAIADAPREWSFPRDHGAHDEFQSEWWYYTGHLQTDDGRSLGFEIVFFRAAPAPPADLPSGYEQWRAPMFQPAHFALTDPAGGRFRYWQRLKRAFGGLAGADTTDLNVWCDDWRVGRRGSAHELEAAAGDTALSLELVPLKPPALHGEDGLSRKGPRPDEASYYYSLTRMVATGTLTQGDETCRVTGTAWMDHEFFSTGPASTIAGWEWYGLQLDDDTELMLYRLRGTAGAPDRLSGTLVPADGSMLPLGAAGLAAPGKAGPAPITLRNTDTWLSPRTGIRYSSGWEIQVPGVDLSLTVTPTLPDQELDTRRSTGVIYWEGSVTVRGTRRGAPVAGRGYVELTGRLGAPGGGAETPGPQDHPGLH